MKRSTQPGISELSRNPADKLAAALTMDAKHLPTSRPSVDKDLPVEYLAACREWYDAMAPRDKAMADAARATFDKGDEKSAELIAVVLPAAPRFPMS